MQHLSVPGVTVTVLVPPPGYITTLFSLVLLMLIGIEILFTVLIVLVRVISAVKLKLLLLSLLLDDVSLSLVSGCGKGTKTGGISDTSALQLLDVHSLSLQLLPQL